MTPNFDAVGHLSHERQAAAAAAIAAPAVICGGLALVADESLFPQIAALPTFAVAVAGAAEFAFVRSASS